MSFTNFWQLQTERIPSPRWFIGRVVLTYSMRACKNVSACVVCPALPSVANTHMLCVFPYGVCVACELIIFICCGYGEGGTDSEKKASAGDRNQSERHLTVDIDRDLFIGRKPPSVCQTLTFRNPRETLGRFWNIADDMADFSIDQNNLPGVKEGEWERWGGGGGGGWCACCGIVRFCV